MNLRRFFNLITYIFESSSVDVQNNCHIEADKVCQFVIFNRNTKKRCAGKCGVK
jgi:hypothetical protein